MNHVRELRSRALVPLVLEGDEAASTELFILWKDSVYSYIYRWSFQHISQSERDEIFQESMLAVFSSLNRYDIERPFGAWLFGIVRNRCRTQQKKHAKVTREDELQVEQGAGPCALEVLQLVEQETADGRVNEVLMGCLSRLSPGHRTLVLLRLNEGLSYKELEEIMGATAVALRQRLSRALVRIRDCMRKKGVECD